MNPTSSQSDLKFQIGHVLFIDIVGYSKLLLDEQKERLRELTDIVLATHQVNESTNEQLVRLPTGDGMALVFRNSSEEPARCALEIAQSLKQHPAVLVRMGIHSGPVSEVIDVNGRTNIAGAGINIAQRVMDCGDARHILLSRRVAEDLEQYRQWSPSLHDLGECEVKHGVRISIVNLFTSEIGNSAIPARCATVSKKPSPSGRHLTTSQLVLIILIPVTLLGIPALIFTPAILKMRQSTNRTGTAAESPVLEKSIAVLPFENLSDDKSNAYFADGIQDEILTRLSKIADLKVISRTSTQHYKSAPDNLSEVGRQLRVAHIVEGSVQKSADAVRVNVQLIKAADDSHLWAETFDRKLTDIFSVESEVAKAIADQLQAKLTGQEEQVIAAKPTDNPEAYDSYLRGLAYTLKPVVLAIEARNYLSEAVHLDPKFALAWALLSYVDSTGYRTQNLPHTDAIREEARQAAERALSLQPSLGEAVFAEGYYHYSCLSEYDVAISYFEQARRLLPNSSVVPQSLAYVCRRRGQWRQSESYFNQAEQLDPRNVNLLTQHASLLATMRRFPEASRKFDQVLDIAPDDPEVPLSKAAIAQAEGDLPRAAKLLASQDLKRGINHLGTQVYQAILERRPAEVIPRIQEALAAPGPYLKPFLPEARFWLGRAEEMAGDRAAARQTWQEAATALEASLNEEPNNYTHLDFLALVYAGLGNKAAALSVAQRAMDLVPIEKDALSGPGQLEIFARVAAQTGETDQAIAALQKLLAIPYEGPLAAPIPLTRATLRLDPMFDPLRNDPRFQRLIVDEAAMPTQAKP